MGTFPSRIEFLSSDERVPFAFASSAESEESLRRGRGASSIEKASGGSEVRSAIDIDYLGKSGRKEAAGWLAWVAAWVMWEKKMWPRKRGSVGRSRPAQG